MLDDDQGSKRKGGTRKNSAIDRQREDKEAAEKRGRKDDGTIKGKNKKGELRRLL